MSRTRVNAYTNNTQTNTASNKDQHQHKSDQAQPSPPVPSNYHLAVPSRRSPPRQPLPPPRMQSGYRDSAASTASMPFSSIGKMLSQPYDSDSEPEEAPMPVSRRSPGPPSPVRQLPDRGGAIERVSTPTGFVASPPRGSSKGAQQQHQSPGCTPAYTATPTYPQPSRPTLLPHSQNQRSQHDLDHLQYQQHHQQQGHQSQQALESPRRPRPTINTSPSFLHPHPLPRPSTPISPALAAPPLSTSSSMTSIHSLARTPELNFSPPRSLAGTAMSRDSTFSSSDSIRGFDAMKEKKALFRGGNDELMSPISPRPRREDENGRAVGVGMRRTVVGMPGGEFWKRFSVMVRLDEAEKAGAGSKDSAWLEKDQRRKRRVKIGIVVSLVLIILAIVGIVVGVTISNNQKPSSSKSIKSAAQV